MTVHPHSGSAPLGELAVRTGPHNHHAFYRVQQNLDILRIQLCYGLRVKQYPAPANTQDRFLCLRKQIAADKLEEISGVCLNTLLGFLHIVRVCTSGFDCLSSAKPSPFSPTPFSHNVHKSGFFPPGESVIQNSKKHINLAYQKREIYVRKRSQEPRKPQFTGLLSSRFLPKKRC